MNLWNRSTGQGKSLEANENKDVDTSSPHKLYAGLMERGALAYRSKLTAYKEATAILDGPVELQRDVLLHALADQENHDYRVKWLRIELLRRLLQRKLPLTAEDLIYILGGDAVTSRYDSLMSYALGAAERFVKANPMDAALEQCLQESAALLKQHDEPDANKQRSRILSLLGEDASEEFAIDGSEPWAQRILDDVDQLDDDNRSSVRRLLAHASSATAGKPSKKWLKECRTLVASLDENLLSSATTVWLEAFAAPPPQRDDGTHTLSVSAANVDLLKGMIWAASLLKNDALIRAICKAGQSGQRKLPGFGARCAKVTNAAVWALGQIDHPLAISQLAILKSRIKNKSARKQIDKAMNEVAERLGVPPADVEEMAVPAFGLDEVGKRVVQLGDFTARLLVTGTTSTELRWIKPDGKLQKSVPKAVKEQHADELKELKAAAKDIQTLLPTQRERIDSLFLDQKVWSFADWSERYLDHPLVGSLARRVIWEFEAETPSDGHGVAAIWNDGLVDAAGQPIELHPETTVRLWHPIEHTTEEVLAWREFLDQHQIVQPFKQAHREIYVLTDAERNTGVYSNRFAAHILKQHQFNALCGARRWNNKLRLMVDDTYPPAARDLEKWGLRAEFWVEGAGSEYGIDTNETGTYLYLATDQVRFYPLGLAQHHAHAGGGGYTWGRYRGEEEPQPVPVEDIPPLVFSEIMRDVDLFVGVASVGNDPNWDDGGPNGRYVNYWHDYSFGQLNATAQTRKEILERLVPRLKIAKQCSFEDKFIVVEGSKRTYKIHLGSGNILMKPNDRYLCIVPKASTTSKAADKMYLPFEGDRMMSIILSKALLLAEDNKIKDPTILSQIVA